MVYGPRGSRGLTARPRATMELRHAPGCAQTPPLSTEGRLVLENRSSPNPAPCRQPVLVRTYEHTKEILHRADTLS